MAGFIGNTPTKSPLSSSDLPDNIVTSAKIADATIVNADINDMASSKLTGALPAVSGASLTSLPAGNLTGSLPAISGASLTGLPAHTGNVAFPASQVASADANTLDEYEEGTWTLGHTFGGGSSTITSQNCVYTRIGRVCSIQGNYRLGTASSPSGQWNITGLPFSGEVGREAYFYVALWNAVGTATGSTFFGQYSGGTSFPIWLETNSTGRAGNSGAYADSGDGPIV
jgi:hypothetical protein